MRLTPPGSVRSLSRCSILLVLAQPAAVRAQAVDGAIQRAAHSVPVPTARAVPRIGTIRIDGRIDEDAWNKATPITEFTQIDPEEGKPATERTEVRFLFDDGALYVAARMYDRQAPNGIITRLVRRDADMESDWFQVVIDGYHDHLGRAFFQVNPSGAKFDALGIGGSNPDASWDPIWETATSIDANGWSAEMRIPYSQLRFSQAEVQTWGLQVRRFIQRSQEQDQWSFWKKTDVGGPSRFGHLEGMHVAGVPRHVEVVPYVVGRASYVKPDNAGNPFNDGSTTNARVGGDVKALLTSNLTLNLTLNPDFGQVEVDPASVNLSAFETFFSEKRPFFVADAGVFDFGNFNCYFCSNVSSVESFYSRRIGRSPQGADLAANAGQYADIPENSTILGAAKVTGRTESGLTVGLLNAVTRKESARVSSPGVPEFSRAVEPLTNYFVGRVKRDYRDGDIVVGGFATSVIRNLDDAALADRLNKHAESVGADLVLNWDRKNYSLLATTELSNIEGSPAAILRAQTSSARYYQRPDRQFSHGCFLSGCYDPTATSMRGLAGYARIAKDGGNLNWETAVNTRTPGFEMNDISFQSRADYIWQVANVLYNWTIPTSWYRYAYLSAGGQQQVTYDGVLNDRQLQLSGGGQTLNFWNLNGFYLNRPRVFDDRQLRGGPIAVRPASSVVSGNLSTDGRSALVFNVSPQFMRNEEGGFSSYVSASARLKPASNVAITFGPSYQLSTVKQQYVSTIADSTATAFYGKRYVLSSLTQKTLSLDTRLAVTFTPSMTLELYAQPFIASGDYFGFGEYDAPRELHKSVYGTDRGTIAVTAGGFTVDPDGAGPARSFAIGNPDFTVRSLQGNAVFRWEYRPGSTLFLVWTQQRNSADASGSLDFSRDRTDLLTAHPDNIFLVKYSYWLGR
ncbi:MAG: putative rane associated hydrolase [Gemmatimonadetes bacterium]|nr:putative rane associated hydrolase [Gemmatimonadota bacterium]